MTLFFVSNPKLTILGMEKERKKIVFVKHTAAISLHQIVHYEMFDFTCFIKYLHTQYMYSVQVLGSVKHPETMSVANDNI